MEPLNTTTRTQKISNSCNLRITIKIVKIYFDKPDRIQPIKTMIFGAQFLIRSSY